MCFDDKIYWVYFIQGSDVMPYREKKTLKITCVSIIIFLITGLIHNIEVPGHMILLASMRGLFINLVYIGLTLFWGITLHQRVLQKNILRYLQLMNVGVLFWMLLRFAKYEFFYGTVGRYLWYIYYLPQIVIPLLCFYCALSIGCRETENDAKKWQWLWLPAIVLFVAICTNDIHQLAFKFKPGMVDWGSNYTYGIIYYAAMIWMIGLMIISLVIIYRKCSVAHSKKKAWIPVIMFISGIILGILQILGKQNFYNIPEILCATFIFMWESCIQIGLFPINHGYGNLFKSLSIPAELVDSDGKIVYKSGNCVKVTEEEKKKALIEPVNIEDDYRLNAVPVKGGTFFYCDNMYTINEVNKKLNNVKEQLQKENILIKEENEIKKREAKVDERNRLYDEISMKIRPQIHKIESLLNGISNDDSMLKANLPYVCIYGGYIKRLCNLMILQKENHKLPIRELENCIKESLEYISLCNIEVSFENKASGTINSEELIQIYSIFEVVIEQLIHNIQAVLIRIEDMGLDISFKIMFEVTGEIDELNISQVHPSENIIIDTTREEDTMYVSMVIRRGGAI